MIAGSIQVYQLSDHSIGGAMLQVTTRKLRLALFVQQMEAELEGCQLKVEGKQAYVKQDNQDLAFGLSSATDFLKTNADGRGYQINAFQCKI